MNSLRKRPEPIGCAPAPRDCVIDYSDEVTKEQVEKIEKRLQKFFEQGEWVTVEAES